MYPYPLFFGLGFYELFLLIGVFAAMLMLWRLTERAGLSAPLHNLTLACSVVGMVGGYFCAVLTQGFYNYLQSGLFSLNQNTGATFLGGLCGGALLFLLIYFTVGKGLLPAEEPVRNFPNVADAMSVCIPLCHGFGRIGCLLAGCCYGKRADWGVYLPELHARVIPVPLFESVILFAIAAFLYFRITRKPRSGMRSYLILYGIARFFLEFFRDDDRGATVVPFLSPSQLTCLLLIALGLVLWAFDRRRRDAS